MVWLLFILASLQQAAKLFWSKRADVQPSRVLREPKRRPQAAAGSELMILAATRDAARLFLDLGTVTIVLAVGARLAARTGMTPPRRCGGTSRRRGGKMCARSGRTGLRARVLRQPCGHPVLLRKPAATGIGDVRLDEVPGQMELHPSSGAGPGRSPARQAAAWLDDGTAGCSSSAVPSRSCRYSRPRSKCIELALT